MKILLMEPNRLLAYPLERGLEEEGIDVTLAHDLSAAKRLAQSQSYDVIILDLSPQIELAVLQYLRRTEIYTPVLFLTAPGNRLAKLGAPDLAPVALLTKPFHFEELVSEIRHLGPLPSAALVAVRAS